MRLIRYEDRLVHEVGIKKRQPTNPLNLVNKCRLGVGLRFGNMIEKLSVFRCNANEVLCAVSSRPVVNWTLGMYGDTTWQNAPIVAVFAYSAERF